MQITFKNIIGTSKGKQCEEFLSILKRLKFKISSKDRRLSFFVDKKKKKFMMTTFAERNLENPPAGSPIFFIEYQFGEDMYNLSNFAGEDPYIFCFDIEDTVKLITHYYETKMSVLKLQIQSEVSQGSIEFQVPDETQGYVPLTLQKLQRFPSQKSYLQKDYIECVPLFQLSEQNFQQLKEIEDIKYSCCYQIHEEGIFFKNYQAKIEGNNFLIKKQFLPKYDPCTLKQKLRGNVFILEGHNLLIEEIKAAAKKNYKKMTVNLIIARHTQNREIIRFVYFEIEGQLILFPKTIKRVICNCDISEQVNMEGLRIPSNEQVQSLDLLKNEEHHMQNLRRIVVNRWAMPRAAQLLQQRILDQRERQGVNSVIEQMVAQTTTRKFVFKIQERR